jgi:thiol-disulfide isomerase/thioredoxin
MPAVKITPSPLRGGACRYERREVWDLATGNWINSEPLKLNELRGRVVLIEFWTFGCINCRNTLPFVKSWDDRYREKGLFMVMQFIYS